MNLMEKLKIKSSRHSVLFIGITMISIGVLCLAQGRNFFETSKVITPGLLPGIMIVGSGHKCLYLGDSLKHLYNRWRLPLLSIPVVLFSILGYFLIAYLFVFITIILGICMIYRFIKMNKSSDPRIEVDDRGITIFYPLKTLTLDWSQVEEFHEIKYDDSLHSIVIVPKDDSVLKSQMNISERFACINYNKLFLTLRYASFYNSKEAYLVLKSAYERNKNTL